MLGTVGYMAPEQVRGRQADHRADIFAFGVVLYEMLTGERAFAGDSAIETMSAILKADPMDTPSASVHVTGALEPLLRHCLEKAAGRALSIGARPCVSAAGCRQRRAFDRQRRGDRLGRLARAPSRGARRCCPRGTDGRHRHRPHPAGTLRGRHANRPERSASEPRTNSSPSAHNNIEVASNGQRFLVNTVVGNTDAPLEVTLNWAAHLKR